MSRVLPGLTRYLPLVCGALALQGCSDSYEINYEKGTLPSSPTALTGLNTEYDDFNSAGPPTLRLSTDLLFSSNRASAGGQFDITVGSINVTFNQDSGKLEHSAHVIDCGQPGHYPSCMAAGSVNTSSDELGPTFTTDGDVLLYASDRDGTLDIFAAFGLNDASRAAEQRKIPRLNSESQDAYATFSPDIRRLLFTSDRNGSYDLFEAPVSPPISEWLMETSEVEITPSSALNSPANDKCPYLNERFLVFTSDRNGGYGGFDLYYSRWKDGAWSEPINFGPSINTPADEYRAIVLQAPEFTNDLMIFSSNRAGGLGGYDLYMVGIDKMAD
jgi:WD40-like Beta Propeller Repeat